MRKRAAKATTWVGAKYECILNKIETLGPEICPPAHAPRTFAAALMSVEGSSFLSCTSITCPHCKAENVNARILSGGHFLYVGGEARYFFAAACSGWSFPSIIVTRRSGTRIAELVGKHVLASALEK